MTTGTCLIWGTPASSIRTTLDGEYMDSPRVDGKYYINGSAKSGVASRDDSFRTRLTTWLIDQRLLGIECPEITSITVRDVEKRLPLSVHERADRVLKFLSSLQAHIGEPIGIEATNPGERIYGPGHTETGGRLLAHSEAVRLDESNYLLETLVKRGFLEIGRQTEDGKEYSITIEGYTYLSDLDKVTVLSKQAFVAMWFHASVQECYEKGIDPAIREAGYEPLRIDSKETNNKIDDEIVAEIKRSRFLVADFTQGDSGARGGVYYEAGFAHGLDIPVIFTCRADAIGTVHFDTRQYNHIVWNRPEELRDRLSKRISATIGDGPLRASV